jgi:putative tricarboxylic transport membrane protein
MTDRIFGVIGLALAALFIWRASVIELSFITDPLGPKTFPIILAVMMAVASIASIIKPDAEPIWPPARNLFEIAVAVAVMTAYAVFLPDLGFLIATALAATFLTWRLGTKPIQSVIAGVCTSVGIWAVFGQLFGLSLAKGFLGV